ncbi:uncharacterized protein VP01_9g6 [Puccinia sorghi]|uniref:DASH complex subunit DAD2 n=1 Tax=Puccinia sorghi TaxID=27349 RepID=A0A0L6U551_9BASI|nr:uncharacterized protein VP01_9g6 [Puccinia sorghi]
MEKQQELSALVELNQLSHGMAVQLEELSQQFALGAHGALSVLYPLSTRFFVLTLFSSAPSPHLQAIESVVHRWQNVFRAAHLALGILPFSTPVFSLPVTSYSSHPQTPPSMICAFDLATRANGINNSAEAPVDMLVRIPVASTQEEHS